MITFQLRSKVQNCTRSPVLILIVAGILMLVAHGASAQTVTLGTTNSTLYVGSGFSGVYSNFQMRAVLSGTGTTPVTLSALGLPAGATLSFSTNSFTNSTAVTLTVAVTNVTKGVYPITIEASGPAVASTSFNLVAGTLWTAQNLADVNWTTAANWSAGVPGANDAALFQDAGLNTNYVNASTSVESLLYLRSLSGTNHNTTLAPGVTLAVTGTNGFAVNVDTTTGNNKTTTLNVGGAGTLVVSNRAANFTVNSANTGGNATIVTMTNLDTLRAVVSRFGLGDVTMAQGGVGAQNVVVSLAKTNIVNADFRSDLETTNGLRFGLSFFYNTDAFNNGSANTVNLGLSNAFFADNIGIGQARAGSGNNIVRFNPVFTNGAVPTALFRNTNGGRVSLMAVGVDSGVTTPGSNARATVNFDAGYVDMLLDTLWLGRDRHSVNTNNGANAQGGLIIGAGKVDINIARLGYNLYTNNSWSRGTITVNSNGVVVVNNFMELGYVAGDYTESGSQAAQTFGQLTINGGGVLRANSIVVGAGSTNNTIDINAGGTLVVSNSIGSSETSLTRLRIDGGSLTLFVAAGMTNVHATNLVTTVNQAKINIASVSGFSSYPATNVLISYKAAGTHNIGIGSIPAGFNNMQIVDNTIDQTIDLIISTNEPKTLVWRGGENSNWDHSSLNWLDMTSLQITKFTDGDTVIFDDLSGVPTDINITETVLPGQTGTGVLVTNVANAFRLQNGGGTIGNSTLTKQGIGSLEINVPSTLSVQVEAGHFAGTGTLGSLALSTGATLEFGGTVSGAFVAAGSGTLALGSVVDGPVTIETGAAITNSGTIQGNALTIEPSSLFYNDGSLARIGAATVGTNATLINAGTIGTIVVPGSLTIDGTFRDMGVGAITLDSLTISGTGTFIPGGDGIGTTTVNSTGLGNNPGLVRLAQNSATIIKVNFAAPQTNTMVLAERFAFGPSQTTKSINGGTLSVQNVGATPFAAGQELTIFGNSSSPGSPFFDAGLNTTNSYPMVLPASPGPGLVWDSVTTMIPFGVLRVLGVATTPVTVSSMYQVINSGSNVVSTLEWPADHTGWKLQQQVTALDVGLTTNWTDLFGSTLTNQMTVTNINTTNAVFYRLVLPQ